MYYQCISQLFRASNEISMYSLCIINVLSMYYQCIINVLSMYFYVYSMYFNFMCISDVC